MKNNPKQFAVNHDEEGEEPPAIYADGSPFDIHCHTCGDIGVILKDLKRGMYGDPCPDCYDPAPMEPGEVTEGVSWRERQELEGRAYDEFK